MRTPIDTPTGGGRASGEASGSDLFVDLDPENLKDLLWAAVRSDELAGQLRRDGDLAGAVAAQVRADRFRMDAADLDAPGGLEVSRAAGRAVPAWTVGGAARDADQAVEGRVRDANRRESDWAFDRADPGDAALGSGVEVGEALGG